jgi:alanyl-tRNA synthetase
MYSSEQIRQRFIDFWQSEPRNHVLVPNMSLVPNVDSTLLFVNSGMFPLAPYLSGQAHPLGTRLVNFQRCLRTKADEILEIGDNRHTLMFEMMGNWSLGDYFKEEQIPWMLEVYVEVFGLDPHRLYVSIWAGDQNAPRDEQAIELWKQAFRKYGVEAEFSENIHDVPESVSDSKNHKFRIFPFGAKSNWWERAHAPGELGGPTSEIFYDLGKVEVGQDQYDINDDSGRFIEIGNSVFMTYQLDESLKWQPLKQKNVDFGGGFERVVMCAQDKTDIFETDIFKPVIDKVAAIAGKEYKTDGEVNQYTRAFRIVADHGRIVTFLIADGVEPSGKDQGYVLRRFIRRLVRFGEVLGIQDNFTPQVASAFVDRMEGVYPHLREHHDKIVQTLQVEEDKFRKTLTKGLKELEKVKDELDGKAAFNLYETFGFPLEMTFEELGLDPESDQALQIQTEFNQEQEQHQAASRAGATQKFAGGLADQSKEVVKLHTAHHILLRALQMVLGEHVKQRGSNITGERLRMDFSHTEKMTEDQKQQVEGIVNKVIGTGYQMFPVILKREVAEQLGAEMEFGQKYPDNVKVYMMYDGDEFGHSIEDEITRLNPDWDKSKGGSGAAGNLPLTLDQAALEVIDRDIFSMEFCGGPHVSNTSELGEDQKTFNIQKEESSSSGVRRIKGALL